MKWHLVHQLKSKLYVQALLATAAFLRNSLARGEGQGRKRKAYSCFRIVPFDRRIDTCTKLLISLQPIYKKQVSGM